MPTTHASELRPNLHRLIESVSDAGTLLAVTTILERLAQHEECPDFVDQMTPGQRAALEEGMRDAREGRTTPGPEVLAQYIKPV